MEHKKGNNSVCNKTAPYSKNMHTLTKTDFQCDDICSHANLIVDTKSNMQSDDVAYKTAELFKIFGDKTRLKILDALSVNELCVCDITDIVDMTISAISHQLRVLKQVNLIKQRRDGKLVFYSLANDHVKKLISAGTEYVTKL